MENKYLEKIAFLGSTVKGLARAAGGIVKDTSIGYGKNVSNAFGSGYRNHLAKTLNIKNPSKLTGTMRDIIKPQLKNLPKTGLSSTQRRQQIRDTFSTIRGVNTRSVADTSPVGMKSPILARKVSKGVMPDLKYQMNRARIITGAGALGVGYAGNSLLNKINDIRANRNYNEQYY